MKNLSGHQPLTDLGEISDYSQDEITQAASALPAVSHYLKITEQPLNTFEDELRIKRHRSWLKCALATYFQKNSAEEICAYWSSVTDEIINEAWRSLVPPEEMALFALGKLGSSELNLSSDIDVLFVTKTEPHLTKVRAFQKLLSEHRASGFCYRVDMELRPGGTQGPIVPSARSFEHYYGSLGATWERLALIRLRALFGPEDLLSDINSFTAKFSFRRHLDYTLLDDIQNLRRKIHGHYGHKNSDTQVNLKTVPGGIRDIELFVHALLVIYGGKRPHLRVRGTGQALMALSKEGLVADEVAQGLADIYWKLRELENYVQSERDLQTHQFQWKKQENEPEWVNQSRQKLQESLDWVSEQVAQVIGEVPETTDSLPAATEQQKIWVVEKLNLDKSFVEEKMTLFETPVYSSDSARDRHYRNKFLTLFLTELKEVSPNLESSILILEDFIRSTRAKTTLYLLLIREEALRKSLVQLFSYSPYLSQVLCNRPELLDAIFLRRHEEFSDDPELQIDQFAERKMLVEILAGMDFLKDVDVARLSQAFSETADDIASSLLAQVKKEVGCSDLNLLCLGKWGGNELGFRSDLDFIFVTKVEPTTACLKAARRFLTRISENVRGGQLYSVDTRLRPSGTGGPLIVSRARFLDFAKSDAQPWQRQAYLKARLLSGEDLSDIKSQIVNKGLSQEDMAELKHIHARILNEKDKKDIKYCSGGLIDIELSVQAALLFHQVPPTGTSTASFISDLIRSGEKDWCSFGEELAENYMFLRQVEQIVKLSGNTSSAKFDGGFVDRLSLLLFNCGTEQLMQRVWQCIAANQTRLKSLDPRRRGE